MDTRLSDSLGLPSPTSDHHHHLHLNSDFNNLFNNFTTLLSPPPTKTPKSPQNAIHPYLNFLSLTISTDSSKSFKPISQTTSKAHTLTKKNLSVIERALIGAGGGGLAGAFTYVCLHPLDTIKTKLQTKGASQIYKNAFDAVVKTFQANGVLGFYSGVSAVIVGSTASSAVYFGTCEFGKSFLSKVDQFPTVLIPPTAGAMGNIVSSAIMVPKELITQQMQAGANGRSWQVLMRILEKDGVLGLYAGYSATLLRNLPAGVLSYSSFEYLKAAVLSKTGQVNLEPFQSVCCGALAGAISASITTPLDVVKTRLMTQIHSEASSKAAAAMYGGVSGTVKQILKEEGWVGFSRGMGPRVLHSACFSALGYFAFETAKLMILHQYLKRKEEQERSLIVPTEYSESTYKSLDCLVTLQGKKINRSTLLRLEELTHSMKVSSASLTQELKCVGPSPSGKLPLQYLGVGRAFYVYPIRFLDSATKMTASFTCQFSFTITPVSPLCPHGDGIAFLITSNAGTFSRANGYIGLPDSSMYHQDSFVAVEFDTSFDPQLGDTSDNHIGIDVNTVRSFASVDALSQGIDLKSGKELTAWIEYRDSLKMIRVWIGCSANRPVSPLLVAHIDLSKQFKEFMHVGFSAANGKGSALHSVRKWHFKTFGSVPLSGSMDSVEEGDCFMCSADGSFSTNDEVSNSHSKKALSIGLGGAAAFIVSVTSIVVISWLYTKRKKRVIGGRISNKYPVYRVETNRVPARLTLSELQSATMGFNQNNVIGKGASSVVYEGHLPSGGSVAVKRFKQSDRPDIFRKCFRNEFATMTSCLRHKNLVQLHGWCCEGNELVLVYEYLPNGSLDKLLHENSNLARSLNWEVRLNIVFGVASALTYLHEECEKQIIHRDVKSCNIMLDENFNPKLGDFGLAEMYERNGLTRKSTIPAGTMGYLAPEYVYSGVPTEKSDVYSFGVVVLELATGRRPLEEDGVVVIDWVWKLWAKKKVMEAVDSRFNGRFKRVEMERLIMVGLSCVHPDYKKRPTVKEAARILRGELALPVLPLRKPMVRIRSVMPQEHDEVINSGGNTSPGLDLDESVWLTPRTHFG